MRTHTGERPFKCKYENCDAAFKALGHLNEHVKIHLKYRPFKCPLCVARFSRQGILKKHLKSKFHKDNLREFNERDFISDNNYPNVPHYYHPNDLKIEKISTAFLAYDENLPPQKPPLQYEYSSNSNLVNFKDSPLISTMFYFNNASLSLDSNDISKNITANYYINDNEKNKVHHSNQCNQISNFIGNEI